MASSEQQLEIVGWLKLALEWAGGTIKPNTLHLQIGQPKHEYVVGDTRTQGYFPGFGSILFDSTIENGTPKLFTLKVEPRLDTNIPKESFETSLGLHRVVRGELIDGQREEKNRFFNPNTFPNGNTDLVTLNYRVPQVADAPFDVYVSIDYLGQNGNDGPEFKSLQSATNLRQVTVHRRPLSPDELEQRNQAKRQRYGYMNLRTGVLCPETGWWEGWTTLNEIDTQVIRAGARFPQAVLNAKTSGPDGARLVDAHWMWRGPYYELP